MKLQTIKAGWLGYSTVLINKNILNSSKQYHHCIASVGIGTILGFYINRPSQNVLLNITKIKTSVI